MTCPRCQLTGGTSHHFEHIGMFLSNDSPISIFYTNPAFHTEHIDTPDTPQWWMSHLDSTHSMKWIWIIDCHQTSHTHLVSVGTAKRLMNLLYEYHKDTLQGIYIIQPSWTIKTLLKLLIPFAKRDVRHRLFIYSHGILDTVTRLQAIGIKGPPLDKLIHSFQINAR